MQLSTKALPKSGCLVVATSAVIVTPTAPGVVPAAASVITAVIPGIIIPATGGLAISSLPLWAWGDGKDAIYMAVFAD